MPNSTGLVLVLAAVGVLILVALGYVVAYLAFLKKAGPNEVIVVSGRHTARALPERGHRLMSMRAATSNTSMSPTAMSKPDVAASRLTTRTARGVGRSLMADHFLSGHER